MDTPSPLADSKDRITHDAVCNRALIRSLRISDVLLALADRIDDERTDTGCGILSGILRDAGYKIHASAAQEIQRHQAQGRWDIPV